MITPVKSREEFIKATQQLSKESTDKSISKYLDSLAAWVEDMDGYYLNKGLPIPEKLDWQTVTDMLTAARFYE